MNNSGQTSSSWAGQTTENGISQGREPIPVRGFDPSTSHERPAMHGQLASLGPQTVPSSAPTLNQQSLRRRSSVADRINQVGHIGGLNSLNNFARSWQRAVGFYQLTPNRRGSISTSTPSDSIDPSRHDVEHAATESGPSNSGSVPHTSLLRAALESDGRKIPDETPIEDDELALEEEYEESGPATSDELRPSVFSKDRQAPSPYGTKYGSIPKVDQDRANRLYNKQQKGSSQPDKEREPLLVKNTEREDDKLVPEVIGQSTVPQTIFNSVNVLVGVGMLALPLAILYAGWLIGLGFFVFSAVSTSYTAKLLARCLNTEKTLITFSDIAYAAFGARARVAVSVLFTFELLASCVALVVLFGDTMHALVPNVEIVEWKIVCGVALIPLAFFPLRFLSFSSILGIGCCVFIVVALIVDGIIKPDSPGSLRDPAKTYLFPENWKTLPLAFGLLMAPWGGHGVFPNIYRDMRHPQKYDRAVNVTYGFTTLLELALAIIGYLMFGDYVRDEVTNNIFYTQGYPRWLSICIGVAIAVIPLTKVPLAARPIISTAEIYCGLDARALPGASALAGMSGLTRGFARIVIRIVITVVIVVLGIFVPDFDRIMSFLGSLACFTVCIILPCSFYLKLFGKEISVKERIVCWFLLVLSTILAVVGTVVSFFPKDMLGVK